MTDYKSTLNLPQTNFSMKANLATKEPEILAFWEKERVYVRMQELRKAQTTKKFILQFGPPYANGDIHLGHALSSTLKDIVTKFKNLDGVQAPFIPGWDCGGLPIEVRIEKILQQEKHEVSAPEFRRLCREYAEQQIVIQKNGFKRIGVFGDWDKPYLTMDNSYVAHTLRTLAQIIHNGHFVSGFKPVHWCTDCQSALAEAEVEYKDKQSLAIEVAFRINDQQELNNRLNINLNTKVMVVVWTTTPWTLPANEAVCLHPEFMYVLVEKDGKHYILAQNLLKLFSVVEVNVITAFQGLVLEGLQLCHPFYNKLVPIIVGDHVTDDIGTGCVHTAPAHGMEDYIIAQKYNLPINNPVLSKGCFKDSVEYVAGLHVLKANAVIVELLRTKGHLIDVKEIMHSYPHCWRHKTPLIFLATRQWFISLEKQNLREQALQAIKQVKWLPVWGEQRIHNMLAGRPDWCVSRQRTWGIPLPLFVHQETHAMHPHTVKIIETVADLIEHHGVEHWHTTTDEHFIGKDSRQYKRLKDTLDVWFDSGCVHAAVAAIHPDLCDPVDLYLEGSDQYRGWFHSSLLVSVAAKGFAPYKEVVTHGFTLDVSGQKMSKSLGNVISPANITKTLGADVLRLWVASSDYTRDVHVSEEILKRMSDGYRRIRNTARFLLANLGDFTVANLVEVKDLVLLDRWLILRVKNLQQQILEAYNNYQFHLVIRNIHNFCINDLGSFYLDIIKDRQYTGAKNGKLRRSAQTAMYHALQAFVRWLAPILSFTSEEIWQHMGYGEEHIPNSVFLTNWWNEFPILEDDLVHNDRFWENLQRIRGIVNKELELLRQQGTIGSGLDAEVRLYGDEVVLADLQKIEAELKFLFITSRVELEQISNAPKNAISSEEPGLKLLVQPSPHKKCLRCWHKTASVGADSAHPEICTRCVTNIMSEETRVYV